VSGILSDLAEFKGFSEAKVEALIWTSLGLQDPFPEGFLP
jgi:hypothetical protein